MRFVMPILLAGSLLAMPALAQPAGPATPATPNGAADTTVQPTSPEQNAPMGTSSMGSSSTGASMVVGAPTGASMAPNPGNCGTPDEPKPCTDARARARPAAAHP